MYRSVNRISMCWHGLYLHKVRQLYETQDEGMHTLIFCDQYGDGQQGENIDITIFVPRNTALEIARACFNCNILSEQAREWLMQTEEMLCHSYNDDMDGDHASALASAGMGTDEDYGSF